MTDRYHSLTIVLETNIRDDDSECIINAIKMIRGVLSVKPHVANIESNMAEERARQNISEKLWEVLHPS